MDIPDFPSFLFLKNLQLFGNVRNKPYLCSGIITTANQKDNVYEENLYSFLFLFAGYGSDGC